MAGPMRAVAVAGIALLTLAGCAAGEANSQGIRVERVEFVSGGERIVGDIFHPADAVPSGRAVVVTGAWMTVRQQMATRYARELAERGLRAMVFDYRGWGESGGTRRQYEDPQAKIVDTAAALDYLAARSDVDDDGVAALGICASAGYTVRAAAQHPAVRSVALVAPWLHSRAEVVQTYGGDAGVAALLETARRADAEFQRTGAQQFVPAASLTDQRAVMFGVPYYTDPARGAIPQWRNEADEAFWEGWLTFDGVASAPRLQQPLLLVHSEAAALPRAAQRFYSDVTAPKDQLWLDGVSQFDFYDRPDAVSAAVDAAVNHIDRTLR